MPSKPPKPAKGKKLDAFISAAYRKHFNCVQVNVFDLSKIFGAAKTAYVANPTLEAIDASMAASLPLYRKN